MLACLGVILAQLSRGRFLAFIHSHTVHCISTNLIKSIFHNDSRAGFYVPIWFLFNIKAYATNDNLENTSQSFLCLLTDNHIFRYSLCVLISL